MKRLLLLSLLWPAQLSAQDRLPEAISTPLEGEVLRIAGDIPDEGTPSPSEHYPVSNEWRHDLWFDALRDAGGAFVGVGTDQCYTLAAIQNAEIAWLVDFDPLVPVVHRMYGVLVRASATPAELVARFAEENEEATAALLEGAGADATVVATYRRFRPRFARYLSRVARLEREGVRASWLSDTVLYDRVRALFAGGRIIARNGDVTGERTLRAVGAAASALGVTVRALYFSNAEQFFRYTDAFQANVRSLPTDARSLVLRTFRHPGTPYPRRDTWHYLTETASDFLERLALGYRRSSEIVADVRPSLDADGATAITADTPRRTAEARARRSRTRD